MSCLVLATPSESFLFPRVGSSNPKTVNTAYSKEQQGKGHTDGRGGIPLQLATACLNGLEQVARYLLPCCSSGVCNLNPLQGQPDGWKSLYSRHPSEALRTNTGCIHCFHVTGNLGVGCCNLTDNRRIMVK